MLSIITMEVSEVYGHFRAARAFRQLCLLHLVFQIQSIAGGIQIDTMFVDEGFGSLDEAALSQALKALANLADKNRMVGIISHVAELKDSINKKILVTKTMGTDGPGSYIKIETN